MALPDSLRLIHNTPLVRLVKLGRHFNRRIYLTLEGNNPSGSMKDRVALHCIEDAERTGVLRGGETLVESTSGNTGISLAFAGRRVAL